MQFDRDCQIERRVIQKDTTFISMSEFDSRANKDDNSTIHKCFAEAVDENI